MSIATTPKINRLLADAVPGGLLFAAWLRKEGFSAQLIKEIPGFRLARRIVAWGYV